MAIGHAIMLATITQQMNKVNDAVNSAFKPLIANVCEVPQRLSVEECLLRCTSIVSSSKMIESLARDGMVHLSNIRSGEIDAASIHDEVVESLRALATASKNARSHVVEMFAYAESSPMWKGHVSMLRPLKRNYVRSLSAIENTASQMIAEVEQSKIAGSDVDAHDITREDAISLIKTSHILLGAEPPNWV
ncbi:hypothetical protein [Flyfo siphovirus Tbat2_3]|nr:hypothetical protein [Flyfo siphovirus Tbat2_3]